MTSSVKVIILSQVALPYSKIGSWTTLYRNYLNSNHAVDFIVCPKPQTLFQGLSYSFLKKSTRHKLIAKFFDKRKVEYFGPLSEIINSDDRFVIQIIDNYGLVKPLHDFLKAKGLRKKCYLQFFYHGFAPYQTVNSSSDFYNILDEIIVLTQSSYESFKNKITVLPNYFSVLPNGIDTTKFTKISDEKKLNYKRNLGSGGKTIFLWCAQDRPKKGLHIILDAWRKIYNSNQNIELLVIGCKARKATDGVRFLGQIPNDELPKFYQLADCFLFSTLCLEGFGMSLIEALHCGCYCIASAGGGVPEVLENGKYGKLISNPHFVFEWVDAMSEFLNGAYKYPMLPQSQYSTEIWNMQMDEIILEAKERLQSNAKM